MRFVFVGERQSPKAAQIGATWQNGRMAARTLHAALQAVGLDPDGQEFVNLWVTPGLRKPSAPQDLRQERRTVRRLRALQQEGWTVVAMGRLVQEALQQHKVPHRFLVHPAARGAIRKRETYQAHVREVLLATA